MPTGPRASTRRSSSSGVPTLGICYGAQLLALELGGRVDRTDVSEFGRTELTRHRGRTVPRPAGRANGLDVPPRHGCRASDRRARRRRVGRHTCGCVRGRRARRLRRAVPPGSRAHAARAAGAEELPLRGCGDRAGLDARRGDHRAGRPHPGAGRLGEGALRALGRRRLGGGGAPGASRRRRPADLRFRRPWSAPQGRGRAGGRDLRRHLPRAARPRAGAGAIPHQARGRHRPRDRSARSSARSSSGSSRTRRASWATRTGSSRAPSTRT